MKYFLVGLGNPGLEYENTRHNAGRMALMRFHKERKLPPFEKASKSTARIASGEVSGSKLDIFLPESFMNNSGKEVARELSQFKKRPQVVVVYDDMDVPLGALKISFGRGSGGHRGLESIIKALKTKDFVRVRIGIAPVKHGKPRKPAGEREVVAFLMKPFTPIEGKVFVKVAKKVGEALALMLEKDYVHAMNTFNSA